MFVGRNICLNIKLSDCKELTYLHGSIDENKDRNCKEEVGCAVADDEHRLDNV